MLKNGGWFGENRVLRIQQGDYETKATQTNDSIDL